MKYSRFAIISVFIGLMVIAISACGGGGSSGGSGGSGTGTLTLGVTDAAVDSADHVIVEFTGVSLKPESGEAIEFDFPPRDIDLLALNGGGSEIILDDVVVPAGRYNWVRLKVNAECDMFDSFITVMGQDHPLWIPSGDKNGLKLVSGFHVPDGGIATFTIDFDLRKSINFPQGQGNCSGNYKLKPALRIVDNDNVGLVIGMVDDNLITDPCSGAVYAFAGHSVIPDDVDGIDPDPVTSALVVFDDATQTYEYKIAFLPAGDYTLAFTCQAEDDDPEPADDPITFQAVRNVTVTAGMETSGDLP